MGRWATNRRRGGDAPTSSASPPGVAIAIVTCTSPNTFQIRFATPITYDGSGTLTGLQINGDNVAAVFDGAGPTSTLDFNCATADGSGQPWSLTTTPPEISQPLSLPQVGVTGVITTQGVDLGGGQINLFFSADITLNPGALPDATSLRFNGAPSTVTAIILLGTTVSRTTQNVSPTAGKLQTWAAQPPWILTPIDTATTILCV